MPFFPAIKYGFEMMPLASPSRGPHVPTGAIINSLCMLPSLETLSSGTINSKAFCLIFSLHETNKATETLALGPTSLISRVPLCNAFFRDF